MKKATDSIFLTFIEKKTNYYIAIKIPSKISGAIYLALETLREEYGQEHFAKVFKTITADNGSEFERLSNIEE